jgi:hypothetical protein
MDVGVFRLFQSPRESGKYGYKPNRSPGHYEMQTAIKSGGAPRCYYDTNNERIFFTVTDCPEYGVLELTDFETTPLG